MKTLTILFTAALVASGIAVSAQVQINKPIQLTGGTGERIITNLEAPVNGTDAVNKDYVDAAVAASGSSLPTMMSDLSPSTMNLMNAARYCRDLTEGGYSDWRIAKISEIYLMVATDATITNDLTSDWFLALGDQMTTNSLIFVRMSDGAVNTTNTTTASYYARCVR